MAVVVVGIYAGPAIVAAGVGAINNIAYVGVGLSWMTGSFLTGGRMAQQLPQAFHYATQLANSPVGFIILDQLDPAKPLLVEEITKAALGFIENMDNNKDDD